MGAAHCQKKKKSCKALELSAPIVNLRHLATQNVMHMAESLSCYQAMNAAMD